MKASERGSDPWTLSVLLPVVAVPMLPDIVRKNEGYMRAKVKKQCCSELKVQRMSCYTGRAQLRDGSKRRGDGIT